MDESLPHLQLAGYGVVLREWTDNDLTSLIEVFNDPDTAYRTSLASPFGLTAARDYLRRAYQDRMDGHRIHLAITTDARHPKGEVTLDLSRCSISYVVGAAHRGQHLAARAVQLITEYAHQVASLPQVLLEIEPDNYPSAAVARTAGFHLTDMAPEAVEDKGRSYRLLTWAHEGPPAPLTMAHNNAGQ
jgi:RimJ/RimL family protein N-acetyltransferase